MQSALAILPFPLAATEAGPAALVTADQAVASSFEDDFRAVLDDSAAVDPAAVEAVQAMVWPGQVVLAAVLPLPLAATATRDAALGMVDQGMTTAAVGQALPDPKVGITVGQLPLAEAAMVASQAPQAAVAVPASGPEIPAMQPAPVVSDPAPARVPVTEIPVEPPSADVGPEVAAPSPRSVPVRQEAESLMPVAPEGDVVPDRSQLAASPVDKDHPRVTADPTPQARVPEMGEPDAPPVLASRIQQLAALPSAPEAVRVTGADGAASVAVPLRAVEANAQADRLASGPDEVDSPETGKVADPGPRPVGRPYPEHRPASGGVWERIFVDMAETDRADEPLPDDTVRPSDPVATVSGPETGVERVVVTAAGSGNPVQPGPRPDLTVDARSEKAADRHEDRFATGPRIAEPRLSRSPSVEPTTLPPPQIALSAWTDVPFAPDHRDEGGLVSLPGLPAGPVAQGVLAAPPPSSLPVPHVAAQVAAVLVTGTGEATELALAPEELGRVRLRLEPDAANPDRMLILISVERPETLDLFRRHAGELADAIRAAGYSGADIGFGQEGQGQRGQSDPRPAPATGSPGFLHDVPAPTVSPPRHVAGTSLDLRL